MNKCRRPDKPHELGVIVVKTYDYTEAPPCGTVAGKPSCSCGWILGDPVGYFFMADLEYQWTKHLPNPQTYDTILTKWGNINIETHFFPGKK